MSNLKPYNIKSEPFEIVFFLFLNYFNFELSISNDLNLSQIVNNILLHEYYHLIYIFWRRLKSWNRPRFPMNFDNYYIKSSCRIELLHMIMVSRVIHQNLPTCSRAPVSIRSKVSKNILFHYEHFRMQNNSWKCFFVSFETLSGEIN